MRCIMGPMEREKYDHLLALGIVLAAVLLAIASFVFGIYMEFMKK